jgi:hypothetical protein
MNLPAIIGNKKKSSSSSSSSPTSAPNTLRSRARARLLELVSEGPIEGLVSGAKSIYFDETAVQAQDDSYNYPNVSWEQHFGLADEGYFNGNSTVETPVAVDVDVKISSGPVVRSIALTNADAVRVIVTIPSLYKVESDGSIKATSLSYAIDVQPSGGVYATVHTENIVNEKTSSPYQRSHRIPLPQNGAPWNVRVRRITADSTDSNLQNDLNWESYTILVEGKFIYPHSAIVSLEVNAEDMGSSIPSRFFHVKGLKIQVPINYNPISRAYTGNWNGTFKTAWTNNPAWIFYDLMVNNRYGLGEFIDSTKIDKWALYTIGQYCDEQVPSGFKNDLGDPIYEPRYTFNGVINSRDEAFTVLRQIATAWRGMSYWAAGQVFPTADMPEDPVKLVTPANVIDGRFEYSSSSMKSRHSVAIVQWNDPEDFYKPAIEVVIDDEMLKKFGWREKSVSYVGCTSRGLARRYGKWLLDVEKHETETVTYTASFDHSDARPGKIVQVSDPAKSEIRLGGRLKAITRTVVTFDAPFPRETGVTYSVVMILPDGKTLVTKQIASFGGAVLDDNDDVIGYTTATFSSAFAVDAPLPIVESMYVITAPDKQPREYRIISVREQEASKFQIVALQHDPYKYARIELGIEFDTPSFVRPTSDVKKPTNFTATESVYLVAGRTRSIVNLSWSKASALTRGYRIAMLSPDEGLVQLPQTQDLSIDVRNLNPGNYTFYLYAIGPTGFLSQPAELIYTVNGWSSTDSPVVSNVELLDRPGSSQFVGRNVHIKWTNTLAAGTGVTNAENNPLYKHNEIKVYDNNTNELLRTEIIKADEYIYTYDKNVADNVTYGRPASRALKFTNKLYDKLGRSSTLVTTIFTNSKPATITPTVEVSLKNLNIQYQRPGDPDFEGVKIWVSTTSGFNPNVVAPVYDGSDTSFVFSGNWYTSYYVRVAGYDAFDRTGLNISPEVLAVVAGSMDVLDPGVIETLNNYRDDLDRLFSTSWKPSISTTESIIAKTEEMLGRRALKKQVGDAYARIAREETVRVERELVQAGIIEAVDGRVDDANGLISNIINLEIDPNSVLAQRFTLLNGDIDDITRPVTGSIAQEAKLRVDGDGVNALAITNLTGRVGNIDLPVTGSIAQEAKLRVDGDKANADLITLLTTRVGNIDNPTTGTVRTEAKARADGDLALSELISEVRTTANRISAQGLIKLEAITTGLPAGTAVRFGTYLRTGTGANWTNNAAEFLEIVGTGASAVSQKVIVANRTRFANSAGTVYAFFDATGTYLNNAIIKDLTSDNIKAGSIKADRIEAGKLTATQIDVSTLYVDQLNLTRGGYAYTRIARHTGDNGGNTYLQDGNSINHQWFKISCRFELYDPGNNNTGLPSAWKLRLYHPATSWTLLEFYSQNNSTKDYFFDLFIDPVRYGFGAVQCTLVLEKDNTKPNTGTGGEVRSVTFLILSGKQQA